MKRRNFITLLGGAAATWPLAARAQQPKTTIGFLGSWSPRTYADRLGAIRQGLLDAGFVEGGNLSIEYRWADGELNRLPNMAAELVSHGVHIIIASGGNSASRAAKAATSIIPIVFSTDGDPVNEGLVASLNQPGGNATGIMVMSVSLAEKRLEIFRDVVPQADIIAVMVDATNVEGSQQARDAVAAARVMSKRIHVLNMSSESDIEWAFGTLVAMQIAALIVTADPLFITQRKQIVGLAQRHAIATIYGRRDFVAAGGLISYDANLTELYRQVGRYAGRLLQGEKPADLPVLQPTKFELVVNLKTAKALGLTMPPALLARADEVIE